MLVWISATIRMFAMKTAIALVIIWFAATTNALHYKLVAPLSARLVALRRILGNKLNHLLHKLFSIDFNPDSFVVFVALGG
jgi:hypothetical protein